MTRLGRLAQSPRGTRDPGVADEEVSGRPCEDAMKPARPPPNGAALYAIASAFGTSYTACLECEDRRLGNPYVVSAERSDIHFSRSGAEAH